MDGYCIALHKRNCNSANLWLVDFLNSACYWLASVTWPVAIDMWHLLANCDPHLLCVAGRRTTRKCIIIKHINVTSKQWSKWYHVLGYQNSWKAILAGRPFLPERDYVWVFAIANPSVYRLSVICKVRASYSRGWNFQQYFFTSLYLSHTLTSVQNFTEIVRGELLRWGH